jgi:hypothetical protein
MVNACFARNAVHSRNGTKLHPLRLMSFGLRSVGILPFGIPSVRSPAVYEPIAWRHITLALNKIARTGAGPWATSQRAPISKRSYKQRYALNTRLLRTSDLRVGSCRAAIII